MFNCRMCSNSQTECVGDSNVAVVVNNPRRSDTKIHFLAAEKQDINVRETK